MGKQVMGLANRLTLARIVMAFILVGAFFVSGQLGEGLRFGIFLLASITDWLDGRIARARNETSAIGGEVDSAADKMLVLVTLLMLAGTSALPVLSLIAAAIILLRDVFNAGLRAGLAQAGGALKTSMLGKLKTVVQMLALLILVSGSLAASLHPWLPYAGDVLLWIAAALALTSVYFYCQDAWRQLQEKGDLDD